MAASNQSSGYQCEFIDQVFEDFYCTSCKFVAKKLTVTGCCGETYCYACIADAQEQGKPCPTCGEIGFNFIKHVKYRKKIDMLQVYCSMKERGCDWSGLLDQLEAHVDPDQDNCQYVDAMCPLNCKQNIPKNEVKQHVNQHCAKRPYFCQHCSFKATYEEVINEHIPECKYVPLQCPNLCGVTSERDFIKDHMQICRLEEISCNFSGLGCADRFRREDQEKHTEQNSQKHITLIASLAVDTSEQLKVQITQNHENEKYLEEKLKDQEENIKKQENKMKEHGQTLVEQIQMLNRQNLKLEEQDQKLEQKLTEQEHQIREQQQQIKDQEQLIKYQEEQIKDLQQQFKVLASNIKEQADTVKLHDEKLKEHEIIPRTFTMENFNHEKVKGEFCNSVWFSPSMYTHVGGYNFCLGVYANGINARGEAIAVQLFSLPGEYDDQLKWPVKIKIMLELVNQHGGYNMTSGCLESWDKTKQRMCVGNFQCMKIRGYYHFLEHFLLKDFLSDDKLYFLISEIQVY